VFKSVSGRRWKRDEAKRREKAKGRVWQKREQKKSDKRFRKYKKNGKRNAGRELYIERTEKVR